MEAQIVAVAVGAADTLNVVVEGLELGLVAERVDCIHP